MNRTFLVVCAAALILGAGAQAQEAQPTGDEAREPAAAEQPEDDKAPLPEIDVWEESADADDVFVPSESISADASIAFPSDI